jgi:hypothetical protein
VFLAARVGQPAAIPAAVIPAALRQVQLPHTAAAGSAVDHQGTAKPPAEPAEPRFGRYQRDPVVRFKPGVRESVEQPDPRLGTLGVDLVIWGTFGILGRTANPPREVVRRVTWAAATSARPCRSHQKSRSDHR